MVSRFLEKRNPVIVGAGVLAAPMLGGLATHLLGGTSGAVVGLGGICELAWAILVIGNRHRDPLWLGLATWTIATLILFLLALASALGCDNVNDACASDRGPEIRFEVAFYAMLAFAAAIILRAAVGFIRPRNLNRQRSWRR